MVSSLGEGTSTESNEDRELEDGECRGVSKGLSEGDAEAEDWLESMVNVRRTTEGCSMAVDMVGCACSLAAAYSGVLSASDLELSRSYGLHWK